MHWQFRTSHRLDRSFLFSRLPSFACPVTQQNTTNTGAEGGWDCTEGGGNLKMMEIWDDVEVACHEELWAPTLQRVCVGFALLLSFQPDQSMEGNRISMILRAGQARFRCQVWSAHDESTEGSFWELDIGNDTLPKTNIDPEVLAPWKIVFWGSMGSSSRVYLSFFALLGGSPSW